MANKHDVLRLLSEGLTPREVAQRLGCRPEYVRATRRRATPEGAEIYRKWSADRFANDPEYAERQRKNMRERNKWRYHNDPEYRDRHKSYQRAYYHANKSYWQDYYRKKAKKSEATA